MASATWQAVQTQWPGLTLEVLAQVDSTNSELMRRAHTGRYEPVLLVAQHQSAGRGRLGRQWHSGAPAATPAQCSALTFSLGLPLAPRQWLGLSLALGVALAQALQRTLPVQVGLKWPNDLWWQGRKLGGILIETATMRTAAETATPQQAALARYAVIGVGINLATPTVAPTAAGVPAAGMCEQVPTLDAPTLLALLTLPLVLAVQRFAQQGFAPFRTDYLAHDVLHGQRITTSDGRTGHALGVDDSGALLLQDGDGHMHCIASAEVSVRPQPQEAL